MLALCCLVALLFCFVLLVILRLQHNRIKVMEMELRDLHDDFLFFKTDFDALSAFSLKHIRDHE